MVLHKSLAIGDIHIPYQWSYADSTARGAATGFVASDVGRLARQLDNNSLWMLTNHSPIVWKGVSDVLHASTHQNSGGDEVATATAAVNAIPKANASAKLDVGWVPTGSSSTTVCIGDDSRLSNARTPTSHASSHNAGGGDALAIDAVAGTGSLRTLGTAATAACAGNDARLSDARTDSNAIHKTTSAEISALTEKTTLVSTDVFVIEDSAASYAKKKVQVTNLPYVVFGANVQTASDATRTTTTSATYGTKITITTGANTGTYLVSWTCALDTTVKAKSAKARLYNSTDATVLSEQIIETSQVTDKLGAGGVAIITLAGVAKTINLEFCSAVGGDTTGCQYAYMTIWRIS